MEKNNFDPVVLLMLFGIYFILDFMSGKNIPQLLYGIALIVYYIRYKIIKNKVM